MYCCVVFTWAVMSDGHSASYELGTVEPIEYLPISMRLDTLGNHPSSLPNSFHYSSLAVQQQINRYRSVNNLPGSYFLAMALPSSSLTPPLTHSSHNFKNHRDAGPLSCLRQHRPACYPNLRPPMGRWRRYARSLRHDIWRWMEKGVKDDHNLADC